MDYYGYSGLSEEERRKREELRERSREASRRYWDNITPEQREERKRKAAETRRRTREALEARLERERSYRERAKKAAATRRRNNGTEGLSPWQLEEHKLEQRREYKRRYNEKEKTDRKAAAAVTKPTEWRNVPGDTDGKPHEFRGIPAGVLSKRNARFWAFVDRTGGPEACWQWHGSYYYDHHRGKRSKYGSAYFERGYTTGAHRVAWMLTHGFYIPGYLVVDHLCNTPWCVNPGHLEVVTQGENSRRTHHREPEITRPSTSSEPPWDDRWFPFGRKKYDENGELKEKYRDDIDENKIPPLPMLNPDDYPADRRLHFPVDEPPLLDDDEEF